MTNRAHLREWAAPIVPGGIGAPLVKATRNLDFKMVWLDGTHSVDWDFDEKHLPVFLLTTIKKLIDWKRKEGYEFYGAPRHWDAPSPDWQRYPNLSFWWMGPVRAYVMGNTLMRDTEEGPMEIAGKFNGEEQHLKDTGGKIAYRVAGFFKVKEHLVEVLKEGT